MTLTADPVRSPYWNLVAHFTGGNGSPKRGPRLAPNPPMAEPRTSSLLFPLLPASETVVGRAAEGEVGVEFAFPSAGAGVREVEEHTSSVRAAFRVASSVCPWGLHRGPAEPHHISW